MLGLGIAGPEPDDRDDVGGAHTGMHALVPAQVDPLGGDRDRRREALHELDGRPDAREDRPVVVGVGVHVEHAGVRGQCTPDRVERRSVAALREIGNRLEEAAHPAHSIRHAKRLERASGWRPAGGDITALGGERGYKVWRPSINVPGGSRNCQTHTVSAITRRRACPFGVIWAGNPYQRIPQSGDRTPPIRATTRARCSTIIRVRIEKANSLRGEHAKLEVSEMRQLGCRTRAPSKCDVRTRR